MKNKEEKHECACKEINMIVPCESEAKNHNVSYTDEEKAKMLECAEKSISKVEKLSELTDKQKEQIAQERFEANDKKSLRYTLVSLRMQYSPNMSGEDIIKDCDALTNHILQDIEAVKEKEKILRLT